ncbi:MAG: nickel-responsive transcriptional regulator NikR [Hyphomicrobiales bacterium]
MQRVTITIDTDLLNQLDRFMNEKNYANRSEAIRDITRDRLEAERIQTNTTSKNCIATLSYLYDFEERELAKRLAKKHHATYSLHQSTMQVHVDEKTCHETVILKGSVRQVKEIANSIIAERGIRHGTLQITPVEFPKNTITDLEDESLEEDKAHSHEHTHEHKHVHTHEHTHSHDHWHTHKDGTYHCHPHEHTHSHPHEHIHEHGHSHTHSHAHKNHHHHNHDGDHIHDFRAHDHDHIGEDHGAHTHDHPGHEAELHDDHSH